MCQAEQLGAAGRVPVGRTQATRGHEVARPAGPVVGRPLLALTSAGRRGYVVVSQLISCKEISLQHFRFSPLVIFLVGVATDTVGQRQDVSGLQRRCITSGGWLQPA